VAAAAAAGGGDWGAADAWADWGAGAGGGSAAAGGARGAARSRPRDPAGPPASNTRACAAHSQGAARRPRRCGPATAPQQPSSYRRPAMWCVHTSWSDEEAGLRQVVAGHCRPWKRRKACLRWKSLRAGHAPVLVSVPLNRGCIAQAGQPEPRQGECGGGRPACGQHGAVPVRQVTVDVLPAW